MNSRNCTGAILALAILLLPIDNFPLGQVVLREFGTRPSNFFLLLATAPLAIHFYYSSRSKSTATLALFSIVAILLPFLNFFVANIVNSNEVLGRASEIQWALQTAMYVWMIVSIWVWAGLWKQFDKSKWLWKSLIASTVIQLWFFGADISPWVAGGIFDLGINREIQTFMGGDHDIFRPAGLCSEPSLYASWALLVWPLLIYRNTIQPSRKYGILAAALILTGIASTSRTFPAIFVLQAPICLVAIFLRPTAVKFALGIISIPILILATTIFAQSNASKIASILDESQSMSTLARNSGKETADLVAEQFPLQGAGIGQFSTHYKEFVPYRFLASHEVQEWVSGAKDGRVSTFSLFARIKAEMGYINYAIIGMVILLPSLISLRRIRLRSADLFLLASIIGGVSFFFQQDQFGYQPGLLSLAILLTFKNQPSSNITESKC